MWISKKEYEKTQNELGNRNRQIHYWITRYEDVKKQLEKKNEKETDLKIKLVSINRIPYKIIYKTDKELKEKIATIVELTLKGEEI